MGNTISNRPKTTESLSSDLFLISRSLNELDNTQWESNAITMKSLETNLALNISSIPGYGLTCQNRTFDIDTSIVSIVGHTHTSSDITNLLTAFENMYDNIKSSLSTVGYCTTILDYPEES